MWDHGIFIGSFVPPLIIGVAFGNLQQGVPFTVNDLLYPEFGISNKEKVLIFKEWNEPVLLKYANSLVKA
ncbi:hypothetical protein BBD39_02270 [Arsenophonus endosymbiont of Bemisia tabaci Asia II 3]|nr:hypothetical protein BBD39_02270 [Arsenophonus endosymbiont of Bemisia tabaci Asia II 3]